MKYDAAVQETEGPEICDAQLISMRAEQAQVRGLYTKQYSLGDKR